MHASSSVSTDPPSTTTRPRRVPSRLATVSEPVITDQLVARRKEHRELLGRRADPDEHRADRRHRLREVHPDETLGRRVLERASVEQQLHRAGDVGRRAAVGPAQEAVALEPGDVPADRHLGHVELRRQLRDVNRLLFRDPFEDVMTAVDWRASALIKECCSIP